MSDHDIDNIMDRLKNEIPVNEVLKKDLRKSFNKPKKSSLIKKIALVAAVTVLIVACLPLLFQHNNFTSTVSAAALKISDYISLVDIGGGSTLGVSEYKGTIYVPIAGKGLYSYNNSGFHKLYDKEVIYARVSGDGRNVAFSSSGSISIMDTVTKKVDTVLKADNEFTFYEEPSWSSDNRSIIYTKKVIEAAETHGFNVKESSIYQLNLETGDLKKLADGSSPSFVAGKKAIVYEKDNKVIYKDLTDESEKIVDNGRFPSVSPEGDYIAYVKSTVKSRDVGKNASVQESLADIWIADTEDFEARKQVTFNYPFYFTDEAEWIKSLKSSDVPQVLSYQGMFYYYSPIWSSDSKRLYAIKSSNSTGEKGDLKLVRIDFATQKQTARETVKKFLQALILRNDEYAKSLMKNPPQLLTISNPRQVSYNITTSGIENGKEYVDAEVCWGYTADAYYRIVSSRYYMTPSENGYIIDSIKENNVIEVTARNNVMYMTQNNGAKEELFKMSDIPSEFTPEGDVRFSSMAYHKGSGTLIFSLQKTAPQEQGSSVTLISYNLKDRKFKLIDKITSINGVNSVGINNLTVGSTGKYIAVNLFSQENNIYKNHTLVYNLDSGKKIDLNSLFADTNITSISANYWDGDVLVLSVVCDDQSMSYIYDPGKEQLSGF